MAAFIDPNVGYNEAEYREWQAFIKSPVLDGAVDPDGAPLVRPQYGLINADFFNRMRILLGRTKSCIDVDTLLITYLALSEEDKVRARDQEREHQRLGSVHDDIIKVWPKDLIPTDYTNTNRVDSLCGNPAFTAQAFLQDLELHPDAWTWYSGPKKPDIAGMLRQDASPARRQELEAIYGEAAVTKAWNTIVQSFRKGSANADSGLRHEGQKTAAEQEQEAKAAQKRHESDPQQRARARSRVEALIGSFRVSDNHRVNGEGKAYLRGLESSFMKNGDVDWFAYEGACKAYIEAQHQHKNPAIINQRDR